MFIFTATVSAVSCLIVPAFICIDLLYSCALKLNDDDDDIQLDRRDWTLILQKQSSPLAFCSVHC